MRNHTAILLLAALVFLVGCGPKGGDRKKNIQSVAFETVERTTVTRTVSLIGMVQGERQATAISKIAGRVTEISKPEGSMVTADEPVAYVVNDVPGMDYKPGPVTAPVAGRVGEVYVDVGQTVAPGVPIALVSDYTQNVRVVASVSDQDLRFVRQGARGEVSVTAFPDTVFTGTITRVSPVLGQMSRTATVEFIVENRDRKLIPGMSCAVQLVLEQKEDAVALPLNALFTNGFSKVAVLDGDTARLRDMTTGLMGDRRVEVTSGVEPGDRVITTGKERVEDGEVVNPVEAVRQ